MKNKEELISDTIMQKDKSPKKILAPEMGDMSAEDFRRY
jgi:hypothetical protein